MGNSLPASSKGSPGLNRRARMLALLRWVFTLVLIGGGLLWVTFRDQKLERRLFELETEVNGMNWALGVSHFKGFIPVSSIPVYDYMWWEEYKDGKRVKHDLSLGGGGGPAGCVAIRDGTGYRIPFWFTLHVEYAYECGSPPVRGRSSFSTLHPCGKYCIEDQTTFTFPKNWSSSPRISQILRLRPIELKEEAPILAVWWNRILDFRGQGILGKDRWKVKGPIPPSIGWEYIEGKNPPEGDEKCWVHAFVLVAKFFPDLPSFEEYVNARMSQFK